MNKFFVWAGLASILGLLLAVVQSFWPTKTPAIVDTMHLDSGSIGINNGSMIKNGGNTSINVSGGINQIGGTGNTQIVSNPEVQNELHALDEKANRALSSFFCPLDASNRSNLVNKLAALQTEYGTNRIIVSFRSVSHDKNTTLLENEWIKILEDAGLKAGVGFQGMVLYDNGQAPDVGIGLNSEDRGLANTFAAVMQDLVKVRFQGQIKHFSKGALEITINGTPQYNTNGTVIFR